MNFLFLFPDQWRWDWLGCVDSPYGRVPVSTPFIDSLAAGGLQFGGCRSNAPVCSPSRACLALGQRYHRADTPTNHFCTPHDRPTIFQILREHGYHTMTCGKSDLFKPQKLSTETGYLPIMDGYGFSDGIDHRGKGDAVVCARNGVTEPYTLMLRQRGLLETHLNDYSDNPLGRPAYPTPLPKDAYTDDFAGQSALKLLERAPADKPWLLWVNFPGPHDPYDPPAEVLERYRGVTFPPAVNPTGTPPAHRDAVKDRPHYAACCSNIDEWVGRLVAAVEERGERENTLIVFASDHGEMLGDHGLWTKSVHYEASIRVPLIINGPGVKPGSHHEGPVELIDVGVTLLNLAGLSHPSPSDIDGRSLAPILKNPQTPHRDFAVSQLKNWRCITSNQWKLVTWKDKPDLILYDLEKDPAEQHNVADQHPELVKAWLQILDRENPWAPVPSPGDRRDGG